MKSEPMLPNERKAALRLALVFAARLLGLFIILPIFATYAEELPGANPSTIGLALGIYGLSQGLLQLPMGAISDRLGRKPIIITGLLLFITGSLIAYFSSSIYGIIIGRAIQGMGAIGSTVMAFIGDLTRPAVRTKAMALVGASVGLSFTLAMVLAPVLDHWLGLKGLFLLMAVLGGVACLLVPRAVAAPKAEALPLKEQFKLALQERTLFHLYWAILCLHAILTSLFLYLPQLLSQQYMLTHTQQSLVYFSVMLLSFVIFIPWMLKTDQQTGFKKNMQLAIALLCLALLGIWNYHTSLKSALVFITIFFIGFNFLEATLPSTVSKLVPNRSRGTAMGLFSSCQFLGMFLGGAVGGLCQRHFGVEGNFYFIVALALGWLLSFSFFFNKNFSCNTKAEIAS